MSDRFKFENILKVRWEKWREDFDGKLRTFSQTRSSAFTRVNMWHKIKQTKDSKGKRMKLNWGTIQ